MLQVQISSVDLYNIIQTFQLIGCDRSAITSFLGTVPFQKGGILPVCKGYTASIIIYTLQIAA